MAYEDVERLRDALQRGEERVFAAGLYLLLRAPTPERPGRPHPARGGHPGRDAGAVPGRLSGAGRGPAGLPAPSGTTACVGLPQPGHRLPGHHLPLRRAGRPAPMAPGGVLRRRPPRPGPGGARPLRRRPGQRQPGGDRHLRRRQELRHQAAGPAQPPAGRRRPGASTPRASTAACAPPWAGSTCAWRQRSAPAPQPLRPARPRRGAPPRRPGTTTRRRANQRRPRTGRGESGADSLAEQVRPCWACWRSGRHARGAPQRRRAGGARPGPLPHLRRRRDHRRPGDPRAAPGAPAARPLRRAPAQATADATAAGLAGRLRRYVEGSLAGLFAGPTNVALDRPWSSSTCRAWSRSCARWRSTSSPPSSGARVRRARRPRLLVVDEAWSLLQYPEGGAFLAGLARRARKYYLGLVTISQDVADFLRSPHGRIVLRTRPPSCCSSRTPPPSTSRGGPLRPLRRGAPVPARRRRRARGCSCARGHRRPVRILASPAEHGPGHDRAGGGHRPGRGWLAPLAAGGRREPGPGGAAWPRRRRRPPATRAEPRGRRPAPPGRPAGGRRPAGAWPRRAVPGRRGGAPPARPWSCWRS